ncbi:MAG: jacalin-like lectin [Egibacteraceae bacterium]
MTLAAVTRLGPSGTTSGTPFEDVLPTRASRITKIAVRHGETVDAIEMFVDGRSLGRHGGYSGAEFPFSLESDEYVTKVSGACRQYQNIIQVSSLQFTTNKRISPKLGADANMYGVGNLRPFEYTPTAGTEIVGFFGYHGAYLHALGVCLRPISTIPKGLIGIQSGVNNTLVLDFGSWPERVIQWTRDANRPSQRWQLAEVPGADGFYHVKYHDGRALAAATDNWSLAIEPLDPARQDQQWSLTPVRLYRIVNRKHHNNQTHALSVNPSDSKIILYKDEENANQQWKLVPSPATGQVSGWEGNIENVYAYSGLALDVGWDRGIFLWARDENRPSQRWQLVEVTGADGFYHIKHPEHPHSGDVLAGPWEVAIESPDPAKEDQQWNLIPVDVYRFTNRQTGRDLSGAQEQVYAGTDIVQYPYQDRPNQYWKLIPYQG